MFWSMLQEFCQVHEISTVFHRQKVYSPFLQQKNTWRHVDLCEIWTRTQQHTFLSLGIVYVPWNLATGATFIWAYKGTESLRLAKSEFSVDYCTCTLHISLSKTFCWLFFFKHIWWAMFVDTSGWCSYSPLCYFKIINSYLRRWLFRKKME